jgi:hypothetical protein
MLVVLPKLLYRSRAGRDFYGTESEIWAGFGPVGNTEKKIGVDYKQLLSAFFSCFQRQNFVFYSFLKYCSVRAKNFA